MDALPMWVGPRDDDGTPFLRPSSLSTILSCPAKFGNEVVLGIPNPSGPEARLGTCAHSGLEAAAKAFMANPAGLQPSDVEAAVKARVAKTLQEDGPLVDRLGEEAWTEEEFTGLAVRLAFCAVAWLGDRVGEGWKVLASEQTTRRDYDVNGVGVIRSKGHLDLLLADPQGRVHVVDLKTSSKAPSKLPDGSGYQQDRKHTLQLGQYARNVGDVYALLVLVVAYRKTGIDAFTSTVLWTPELAAWVHRAFSAAARIVHRQEFEPNPIGAGFLCAPKWCAYWESCPSAQPGAPVNGGE